MNEQENYTQDQSNLPILPTADISLGSASITFSPDSYVYIFSPNRTHSRW